MAWLLDTNVLSELRKPKPSSKVVDFLRARPFDELQISIVSLAEIRFGIEKVQDESHRAELTRWFVHSVRPMFGDRVLPLTEEILLRWRILVEKGRKAGHTFAQPDLFIAATALEHGLTVVTRDRSQFDLAGASVLNPWD